MRTVILVLGFIGFDLLAQYWGLSLTGSVGTTKLLSWIFIGAAALDIMEVLNASH